MNTTLERALNKLVVSARTSKESSFYRDLWSGAHSAWQELPYATPSLLMNVSLPARRYKTKRSLTKIVKTYSKPFLSEWSLDDIGREPIEIRGVRPLVMFSDSHRSMEAGFFMHAKGILPLVGEPTQFTISKHSAEDYNIDSFVTDAPMMRAFLPVLCSAFDTKNIHAVVHTQSAFPGVLKLRKLFLTTSAYLSLSETGVIGTLCDHSRPHGYVFHPAPQVALQFEKGKVIVSSARFLVTPIIRYRTNIRAHAVEKTCTCRSYQSFKIDG